MPRASLPGPDIRANDLANEPPGLKCEISTTSRASLELRLDNNTLYAAIIHLPLIEAVSATLSDLGLDLRRTGETLPRPDPPPRMIRAP